MSGCLEETKIIPYFRPPPLNPGFAYFQGCSRVPIVSPSHPSKVKQEETRFPRRGKMKTLQILRITLDRPPSSRRPRKPGQSRFVLISFPRALRLLLAGAAVSLSKEKRHPIVVEPARIQLNVPANSSFRLEFV